MKYKFTPELCAPTKDDSGADKPAKFEGYVMLDVPPFPVMAQIKREATLALGKVDEEKEESKFKKAAHNIEAEQMLYSKLEPMLRDVNLKHVATGETITDIETFISHPACALIISELCLMLMTGFAGKN